MLGRRDIKVRYKQTVFGIGWAVLQPLLAMAVFSIVFGRFARLSSDGTAYPVFAYVGILPWTLVSSIVSGASASLVANERLITKVYFPRLLIPLSVLGYSLLDFALAGALAIPLIAYFHPQLSIQLLCLPIVLGGFLLCGVGCGLFLAALNVTYRDVRHAVPFALQIWMFASPVVYSASIVPERFRLVAAINPLYGLITAFRGGLLGTPVDGMALGISIAASGALFVAGLLYFLHVQHRFADIV
jgi:lipopolysaccharide transport system permease protein